MVSPQTSGLPSTAATGHTRTPQTSGLPSTAATTHTRTPQTSGLFSTAATSHTRTPHKLTYSTVLLYTLFNPILKIREMHCEVSRVATCRFIHGIYTLYLHGKDGPGPRTSCQFTRLASSPVECIIAHNMSYHNYIDIGHALSYPNP